ncbi:hypothetical protein FE392_13335 [Xenorhabdus sp. 12]|uniref:Transglutaminase-like domain-containing protein n=1 Tax=Xenorhabdus santafensis TaxID=2582833 RepID=A0ABU4SBZ1_9GAMM|nr:hypothetical protein [Xenorhabdus sp. 12]MDX7988304.1 hypothetical protein [Xenorhabdus sp. 12]
MPVKTIIKDTVIYTRAFFNLKTTNKHYEETALLRKPEHKRQLYAAETYIYKYNSLLKTQALTKNVYNPYDANRALIETQRDNHVGNCSEYSYNAMNFLKNNSRMIWNIYREPFIIALLFIENDTKNFDHAFLIIAKHFSFSIKDIFKKNYNSEIWVCDPWANIVCRSYEYPLEWKVKMLKWSSVGKVIQKKGVFVKPTDSDIYQLIDKYAHNITISYCEKFDFAAYSSP